MDIPIPDRVVKGQPYWRISSRPHTCIDGRETEIDTWQSFCADCGQPFTFDRGRSSFPPSPNRRCEPHKRPRMRVGSKADKRRLTDDQREAETLIHDAFSHET